MRRNLKAGFIGFCLGLGRVVLDFIRLSEFDMVSLGFTGF